MGLKNGGFATCWDFKESPSGKYRDVQISTRAKNYKTGEFETDFSRWVRFIGEAAQSAATLTRGDRIKITDFEVTATYDKAKAQEYVNFKIWGFEPADSSKTNAKPADIEADPSDDEEEKLPF